MSFFIGKMELSPKSASLLQAQIEYFADRGVKEFSPEQRTLLQQAGQLAKIRDLNHLPEDLSDELRQIIEDNRSRYARILQSAPRDDIERRERNIELYNAEFKPSITALKARVAESPDPKKLPEYLGSGSNGSAYVIEVEGKKYAAKFSRSITQSNFETKPLIQAKGIERTAQLVAYSFEDGVVIMELLGGRDVTNFASENRPEYSDEHIEQLIKTVIELYDKGIVIDPKPSNFMYDPVEGFNVLDFHISNGNQSIGDIVMNLRIGLTYRKWERLDYRADDYPEKSKQETIERNKIYLPLMVRFLSLLREKFPEVLADWSRKWSEREQDPNVSQRPLIDREYIPGDHPELRPYLEKLEEMGF